VVALGKESKALTRLRIWAKSSQLIEQKPFALSPSTSSGQATAQSA